MRPNFGNGRPLSIMPDVNRADSNQNAQRRDRKDYASKRDRKIKRVAISRTEVAVKSEHAVDGHFG